MRYTYRPQAMIDQNGVLVPGAVGQVFALTDTSYTTPLTVIDVGGATRTSITASTLGQTETFFLDDRAEVWFKSGTHVSHLFSISGLLTAADSSATAAAASALAAEESRLAAESAAIGTSDWGNVKNKPVNYPPAPHSHPAEVIVSGVLNQARLGTGEPTMATFLRGDGSWAVPTGSGGGGPADSVEWEDVQNKPANFPPSEHSHPTSQISDLSAIGKSLVTAADAGSAKVTLGLGNVDNVRDVDKPISNAVAAGLETRAPVSHTHAQADITNLTTTLAARPIIQMVSTGNELRPTGVVNVFWIGGTVRPTNMQSSDLWFSEVP